MFELPKHPQSDVGPESKEVIDEPLQHPIGLSLVVAAAEDLVDEILEYFSVLFLGIAHLFL